MAYTIRNPSSVRNGSVVGSEMVGEAYPSSADLKLYVVTHKPTLVPADRGFVPIHAGAACGPDIGILRDDTGDNISSKNSCYSELTAHYWIWKNEDSDYIGLLHYRRYFASTLTSCLHLGKEVADMADLVHVLSPEKFVVAKPFLFFHGDSLLPKTLEQQYVSVHGYDLVYARRALAELSSAYLPTFDFVMRNNCMYAFNLLVTSRRLFEEYCSWLFPVLFAVEAMMNIKARVGYSARVCAFLSERLFTTWLIHNDRLLDLEIRNHVFYSGL